jgi:hypothetical protein
MSDVEEKKVIEEVVTEEVQQEVVTEEVSEREQLINRFTKEALDLVKEWSNEKFGSMSDWFDLGSSIKDIIDEAKDITQIDKITLSLDVIHNVAKEVNRIYGEKLDEKAKEVVAYFISDSHNNVVSGVLSFVGSLLNKIDTNKDGKISKQECNNYCRKLFCCAPIPLDEIEKEEEEESK